MLKVQLIILQILVREARWMYGLEIIAASGGKLGGGNLYIHLDVLQDQDLVQSRKETDEEMLKHPKDPNRHRLYRITEGGQRSLAEEGSAGLVPSTQLT